MSYKLSLELHAGYLHAVATGTHSAENARQCLAELSAACLAGGHDVVLFEFNLSGPSLGLASIFEVIKERSEKAAVFRKFAYVDTSARDPENMAFAEIVARNRGINVRLFREVEAAKRWLSEDR